MAQAQAFETRAKAAIENERFRLTDFGPLIEAGKDLARQQQAIAENAAAESVDFQLASDDRDEAAVRADRARRSAEAIAGAVRALEDKLAERLAGEKSMAAEAERKAALAERDELAEKFAAIVPEAIGALIDLFAATLRNEERLARAGVKAQDAEAVARGLASYRDGYVPIHKFTEMKIPSWEGRGRCWPPQASRPVYDYTASHERIRQQAAELDAKREAALGWYRLLPVPEKVIDFHAAIAPEIVAERTWKLAHQPWTGRIRHEEVERLRAMGVRAEPVEAPVSAEAAE